MDRLLRDDADALATRRMLRDLAALLALPAMWIDHEAADIASGLLAVLFGVLRLESAYARFDDPAGGPPLERWRPDGPRASIELQPALAAARPRERGAVTTAATSLSDRSAVRVTSMTPSLPGADGLVVVGCRRADFPTDLEQHLLRIAIGQAAISIHTARRLAAERDARIAAESALEQRNAFLATLARNLSAPLATLAELAAQTRNFAALADRPSGSAGVGADPAFAARRASGANIIASPLPIAARLTRRETEVLGLLAQGLSNKEIAALLWLSERTVERHITGIYRKIDVGRRSEATAFALRHGLVADDAAGG